MSKSGKKRSKSLKKRVKVRKSPDQAQTNSRETRALHSPIVKKALLSFFVVLLCLAIPEGLCRVLRLTEKCDADFKFYIRNVDNDIEKDFMIEDALLMWSPKPGYASSDVVINSQGFRDKTYRKSKPKGVFRILSLGDSTTFGMGVSADETYHAVLEERLNQERSDGKTSFEIINGGVVGYSSCQGLNLYRYKGADYEPDIVTFCFGINDARVRLHLSDGEIMRNEVPRFVKVLTNKVLLKSHFYRVFRKLVAGSLPEEVKERKVPRVSREQYREYILELNALCRAQGAKLVLVTQPLPEAASRVEPERVRNFYLYMNDLKDISASEDIPLLTVGELTENLSKESSRLFHDLVHPNEAGHQLIADRLHSFLLDHKMLPPKGAED